MTIGDRRREIILNDEEKKVLAEASRILCLISEEMYEDEILEDYPAIGREDGDLYDVSWDILKMSQNGKVSITAE